MRGEPMHPDRLNAVLECPWEAIEFERWLISQPTAQDYLFADEVPRFEPRPEDALALAPGLEVVGDGAGCKLRLGAAMLEVPGVSKPRVLRLLESKPRRARMPQPSRRCCASRSAACCSLPRR
jgi:hypothetical protein